MTTLTIDNWLVIAAIAVAICAPIGQVLFQRYLEQRDRRLTEAQAAPEPVTHRPRKLIELLISGVIFGLPAVTLYFEVISTLPNTRMSTFVISLSVASLFSMALFQFFFYIIGGLLNLQKHTLSVHQRHLSITRELARATEKHALPADSETSNP